MKTINKYIEESIVTRDLTDEDISKYYDIYFDLYNTYEYPPSICIKITSIKEFEQIYNECPSEYCPAKLDDIIIQNIKYHIRHNLFIYIYLTKSSIYLKYELTWDAPVTIDEERFIKTGYNLTSFKEMFEKRWQDLNDDLVKKYKSEIKAYN